MTKIYNADSINPEVELTNEDILTHNYIELANRYTEVAEERKTLQYLDGLYEHFIARNGLEDAFIDFLKDVAENEDVLKYKIAARQKLNLCHVESEGFYMLEDEYGGMKELEQSQDEFVGIVTVLKNNRGNRNISLYHDDCIVLHITNDKNKTLLMHDIKDVWDMREIVLGIIYSEHVNEQEIEYLTRRADELVFENFPHLTQIKWFEEEGRLHRRSFNTEEDSN
ncbi:hypothetical protein ACQCT5_04540 [Sutcliffiella halmapala]